MITHGNVIRLFEATAPWFDFGPGDVDELGELSDEEAEILAGEADPSPTTPHPWGKDSGNAH